MASRKSKSKNPFVPAVDVKQHSKNNEDGLITQAQNNGRKALARLKKLPSGGPAQFGGKVHQSVVPQIKTMVQRFDGMLAGSLDDLPAKPPSEVRIFLSSTFSDMRSERNWLAREAYPKLKDFCYHKLGLDFQVLDMRWGVTDDATNEHATERLCLEEIANCQRLSMGPSFVCILGDRYGFCPLPTEIPVSEYEIIQAEAEGLQHPDCHLLHQWYKRDDNAVPPVYVLQPIRTHLKHFADYSNGCQQLREQDTAEWYRLSERLKGVIHKLVLLAKDKGLMRETRAHEFFKSVTECELSEGLLKAKDAAKQGLCFVRTLQGLDNRTLARDKLAARYTDVINTNAQTIADANVAKLRTAVRTVEVPKVLPKSQIFHYRIHWQAEGVDPDKHVEHKTYLGNFCTDFVGNTIKLMASAKNVQENQIPQTEYYSTFDETLHHLHFCLTKCSTFKGQTDVLCKIKMYLTNPSKRKPLFVYADSGAGKTSVMAMVMRLAPQWLGQGTTKIIRFLGTSPDSTNIYQVLFSVAGHMADVFQKIMEPEAYRNMQKLVAYFPRFLRMISRATKDHIIVLLDSLDQLSPADGAFGLQWLPLELPTNVHIVISTLPETHGILLTARKLIFDPDAFIKLQPLPEETGNEITEAYLSRKKRSLTQEQRDAILAAIAQVPSPLFLKLLLDKAVEWKSYTPLSEIIMASSVRDAINQLFTGLEVKFGQLLISHALGYLTVGLNGLSEVELEDVLSCDDEVLNEIYQYHSPPVEGIVRVPPVLLARVKHKITEYVVERQSQAKTTLYWYHRQFVEAARERYATESQAKFLHRNLADMFLAEGGLKREIVLTKRNLTIPSADRQITVQPLVPENRRKLLSLPYHLAGSGDISRLKKEALCNLKFMQTKVQALNTRELVQDYVNSINGGGFQAQWGTGTEDTELNMVRDCLQEVKTSLTKAHQLPVQLLARLQGSKDLPHLEWLLSEAAATLEQGATSALMPLYPYLVSSTSLVTGQWSLKNFLNDQPNVTTVPFSQPGMLLQGKYIYKLSVATVPALKSSTSSTDQGLLLRCLCVRDGQEKAFHLVAPSDARTNVSAHCFAVSDDGSKLAVALPGGTLAMWDLMPATENHVHVSRILVADFCIQWVGFIPDSSDVVCIAEVWDRIGSEAEYVLKVFRNDETKCTDLPLKPIESKVVISKNGKFVVMATSAESSVNLLVVNIHEATVNIFQISPLRDLEFACMETTVEDSIMLGSHDTIRVINLCTGKQVKELRVSGEIIGIFASDQHMDVTVGTKDGYIHIWEIEGWEHKGKVKCCNGNMVKMGRMMDEEEEGLVVLASDNTLKILSAESVHQDLARGQLHEGEAKAVEKLNQYEEAQKLCFRGNNCLVTLANGVLTTWNMTSQKLQQRFKCSALQKEDFTTDEILIMKEKHLAILCRDEGELILLDVDSGKTTSHDIDGHVLAMTPGSQPSELIALSRIKHKLAVTFFDLDVLRSTKTIHIKDSPTFVSADVRLSCSRRFLFFKLESTTKELEIINKTEKKSGLSISDGKYKFFALDVETTSFPAPLIPGFRRLTKVLMLGHCWEVQEGHCIIIGRGRVIVVFDAETGNCDQKLLKGTGKALFYRPGHIDGFGVPVSNAPDARVATRCMQKAEAGKVIAVGSEDGYLMMYGVDGMGLVPTMGKIPNHGSPVCQLCVSPGGKWVAALGENNVLKVFSIPEKVKEIFSIQLKVKVKQMTFDRDDKHLALVVEQEANQSKVFLFKVIPGHHL